METSALISSPKLVLGSPSSSNINGFISIRRSLVANPHLSRKTIRTSRFLVAALPKNIGDIAITPRRISINGIEAFASISSSTGNGTSSIGVRPEIYAPPPSSNIGSPLFWIGVGVGLSALFSWAATNLKIVASVKTNPELLKIMISGAPASGKGTQCELITKKYGLVHIAAGDLLRAEVEAGSENGKRANEYMQKGKLVPNEIVVMMVKDRLLQPDSQENGWLLDGYPRSSSQAEALEGLGIHPDLFILLDVPEEILVERVVGRRQDPITKRIYHLTYSPPETEEIAGRLTQRSDDTEEKVKLRLQTHNQNVEDVLSIYKDVTVKINGGAPKEDVFSQIDSALAGLVEQKKAIEAGV